MDYEEDVISFDDELYFWKSRAIQLETDLADLTGQFEKMKTLKEQLEQYIMQNEQPKKEKVKRKQSMFQQQFNIFFEQKKKDENFLSGIRNKLTSLELIKDGEKIPWHILRNECKKIFENMPQ